MEPRTCLAADYQRLIDAETWAFIRATEDWYPPETASYSIQRQREVYDRMCQAFDRPYPDGVTAQDRPIGGVPCRIYLPVAAAERTAIYFHGGGFVVGGLHSHDAICAEICAATGFKVVSVDYRLAPEHLHPAAFQDAVTVVRVLAGEGHPLVLVGDSAGANLAAATCHALRGQSVDIAGQCLIYPGLGGDTDAGSYLRHAEAPMLTRQDVLFYAGIRHPGGIAPAKADPTARPLKDTDFAGLPPTLVVSAECDPLADDGRIYVERLVQAGGRALLVEEAGLVHGYLRARHSVTRARTSFARICAGIARLGQGLWPVLPG